MRTVIFVGLITIANAINPIFMDSLDKGLIKFYAIVLLIVMAMDIVEFHVRLKKENK